MSQNMPPQVSKLVISVDSWHYKYYSWLRDIWGFNAPAKTTSLCPYFHTILWGSLLTLLASPIFMFGWSMAKLLEFLISFEKDSDSRTGQFVNWYASTDVGKFTCAPDQMKHNGGVLPYGIFMTFLIALVATVLCGAGILLYLGAIRLDDVAALLWKGILHVGWFLHMVFAMIADGVATGIWLAIQWCGTAFVDFFSWVGSWLFSGSFWLPILKWGGLGAAALIVGGGSAVGSVYAGMAVVKSSAFKGSVSLLGSTGKGLFSVLAFVFSLPIRLLFLPLKKWRQQGAALRAERRQIREDEKKRLAELKRGKAAWKLKKWTCEYCNYANDKYRKECYNCERSKPPPKWLRGITDLLGRSAGWAKTRIVKIGGTRVHVLGFFRIVWEMIKVFKTRACPIIEAVSDADLKVAATAHAEQLAVQKERYKREREAKRNQALARMHEVKSTKMPTFVKPERTWYGAKKDWRKN